MNSNVKIIFKNFRRIFQNAKFPKFIMKINVKKMKKLFSIQIIAHHLQIVIIALPQNNAFDIISNVKTNKNQKITIAQFMTIYQN